MCDPYDVLTAVWLGFILGSCVTSLVNYIISERDRKR